MAEKSAYSRWLQDSYTWTFRDIKKGGHPYVYAAEALREARAVINLFLTEYPCSPGTDVRVLVPGTSVPLVLTVTFSVADPADDRSKLTAIRSKLTASCYVYEEAAIVREGATLSFIRRMDWSEAADRLPLADFGRCYLELPALVLAVEQQHLAQKLV